MAGRRRRAKLTTLASGLLVGVAGCAGGPAPGTVDLLSGDWAHMPGVTAAGDGLHVGPTGARIVEQDGSGGQPNPPLNLLGTHLVTDGDFVVRATLVDVTADASLALYDRPPVIADEFRIEPAGVRLTIRGDELRVTVWDGSDHEDVTRPRPVLDEHVTLSEPVAPLTVTRAGADLEIASGGRTVASAALGDVFTSGELWFGVSSESGWFTVGSLAAEGPGVRAADTTQDLGGSGHGGLRALAARVRPDFRVGAAVALGPLVADPAYARATLSNFSSITPENAMKPQFLAPQREVYTFEEADALVGVARGNGMWVHGHALAFGEAMPRWMQELPTDTAGDRRESAAILLDYVHTVVSHFRGRVDSWDVVNEPLDGDQGAGMRPNLWYRVLGPDYPSIVSQAVHAADPDVLQFVNENGADVPGARQDTLLDLVLDANNNGGHIDGVGLQAHVYDLETDAIGADELTESLDLFADHGLRVRVSENDVTREEGATAQAEQYAAVFAACVQHPACESWTTWGVDDRYNWFVDGDGRLRMGRDFLFDRGEPTPAYHALRRVLGD